MAAGVIGPLGAYIMAAASRAFNWGRHDCATFVIGWAELVSGGKARLKPLPLTERGFLLRRRRMRTEATTVLGQLGFCTAVGSPQDGDIGLSSDMTLMLFFGGFWHAPAPQGGLSMISAGHPSLTVSALWRHSQAA